jgi:hypothetical protein
LTTQYRTTDTVAIGRPHPCPVRDLRERGNHAISSSIAVDRVRRGRTRGWYG